MKRYMPASFPSPTGLADRHMTGMTSSSAGLDTRRRKALYHAWHRGMRETDLMLGGFADREIATMGESELTIFESLLEQDDSDLLSWITGQVPVPPAHDTLIFRRIRDGFGSAAIR
jgi:antitoxin CptB